MVSIGPWVVITAPADTTVTVGENDERALLAVAISPSAYNTVEGTTKLLVKNAAGDGVEWVAAS